MKLEDRFVLNGYFGSIESIGNAQTGVERIAHIVTDAKGGVFTVGHFRGTVDFDAGPGVNNVTSSSMDRDDVFIKRTHADGRLHWVRTLSSDTSIQVNAAALTETNPETNYFDGRILLTGAFEGTADLDPTGGTAFATSRGSTDVFVVVLYDHGAYADSWAFGGTGRDGGTDIAQTLSVKEPWNSIYVSGYFRGTVDFDIGDGVLNKTSSGGSDGFLVRYNVDGTFVQTVGGKPRISPFDNVTDESIDAIGVAAGDIVYAVGTFKGIADFDPTRGHHYIDSGPERAAFIVKYYNDRFNPGIYREWAAVRRATGGFSGPVDITDSIYPAITGVFRGSIDLFGLTSAGDRDIYVERFLPSGNWAQSIGGSGSETYPSVSLTSNGVVIVSGSFQSTVIDLAPGAQVQQRLRKGNVDSFVVALGGVGNYIWGQTVGGSDRVYTTAIATFGGRVILGGRFSGTADFNPGPQQKNRSSLGSFDAFVLELSTELKYTMPTGRQITLGAYKGTADSIILKRIGDRLQLFDANRQIVLEEGNYSLTSGVFIQGADNENDTFTIDNSGGVIQLGKNMQFAGGGGGTDILRLAGRSSDSFVLYPEEIFGDEGISVRLALSQPLIYARDIELAEMRGLDSIEYSTGDSADVLRLDPTTASTGEVSVKISGTVDNYSIVPISITNTANITVNPGFFGPHADRVTIADNSLLAAGLQNLTIDTGLGDDVLTLLTDSLTLPVPGGAFRYLGGEGRDRIIGVSDSSNVRLTDTSLSYYKAGVIQLESIETATLNGAASNNLLNAQAFSGPVIINGGEGNDRLLGGVANDVLNGGPGDDLISGGDSNDRLRGQSGEDQLLGGTGNDEMNGGDGDDTMKGGTGNDKYVFEEALTNEFDYTTELASEGTDTLSFTFTTADLAIDLAIRGAQLIQAYRTLSLNSGETFENVFGGSGDDLIFGNALHNLLNGGNGNNILVGRNGNDTLVAGNGRDLLIGGLGLDKLNGGAGEDMLIAGRTRYDNSANALTNVRTEWTKPTAYQSRVNNLRAGVGSPVVSLKSKTNVLKDGGEDDLLTGGANQDWFFRETDDAITDLTNNELFDTL